MWKGIPNVFCKHSPRNNIFFLFFFYQSNFKRLQFFATLVNSTLSTHLFPYSSSYLKNVERDSYSSIESNQNNTSSILLHPVKHVSMETRRSVAVGLRPLSPPDRVLSFPETVPGRPRDNRSRKDPWRIIFRTGPHRGSTAPPISFFAKIPGRLRDTRAWSRSRRKEERLVFESNYFPPETGEEEEKEEEKIDGGERWRDVRAARGHVSSIEKGDEYSNADFASSGSCLAIGPFSPLTILLQLSFVLERNVIRRPIWRCLKTFEQVLISDLMN